MKINKDNYREILIQYLERELSGAENTDVEQYISENAAAARELALLKSTRLRPEASIGFPNKQMLFREEDNSDTGTKPATVVKLMRFAAFAIAAVFIGFGIIIFMNKSNNTNPVAHINSSNGIEVPQRHDTNQMTAENSTGQTKKNHGKLDKNSREKGKRPNAKDQKKESKSPDQLNTEQEHRTILLVNQPENKDYMAVIAQETNQIDNPGGTGNIPNTLYNGRVITEPNFKNQKTNTNDVAENNTLIGDLMDFLHNVSLKRKDINDKTYYALSIETNNIKIDKTFKSLIQQ